MRLSRGPDDPAQVRGFGTFTGQLSTVALGCGPLRAEDVRRGWLAIRREKIDKAQGKKGALAQTYFRRGGRRVCHPLQEDRMG